MSNSNNSTTSTQSAFTLRCQWTGVQLATMQLEQSVLASCGSQHWRMGWQQTSAEHPFFSLTPLAALRTARVLFRDVLKADANYFELEEQHKATAARVAFVAVLRNMGVLGRKEPTAKERGNLPYILPRLATVQTHSHHLLALAYWYAQAQSPKFKFPQLNIARINSNTELMDIGAYLTICQQQKDIWLEAEQRRVVNAVMDEPLSDDNYAYRANRAERAANAVIAGFEKRATRPVLWNWLLASIQAESAAAYKKFIAEDGEFFKGLFFAPQSKWKNYSIDDIDALEDVLVRFGPLGTAPFGLFRKELVKMATHIRSTQKLFTIDWSNLAPITPESAFTAAVKITDATGQHKLTASQEQAATQRAELAASPEPLEAAFPSKVAYLQARARWMLAKMQQAEADKQAARKQII